MPRTKEQNEAIREKRRKQILEASLEVYIEKGYVAAEIGDIAKQSNVARGLVYYYFKDKVTLFRELFAHMFSIMHEMTSAHFSQQNKSNVELLKQFVEQKFRQVLDPKGSFFFFMRTRHDVMELYTKDELKEINWHAKKLQPLIDTMKRAMELQQLNEMDPELLASQFWSAMIHGMAHIHQKTRKLREQGLKQEQIEEAVKEDMDAAAAVCKAMLRPPAK